MKYICPCRACGSLPTLKKKADRSGNPWFWYQCNCGLTGPRAERKLSARGYWNEDNTEAQRMREMRDAINRLADLLEIGQELADRMGK